MPLKDRLRFLTDPEQVDGFVRENAAAAIFEAGTCHKTSEMFANVDSRLGDRDNWSITAESIAEALDEDFARVPGGPTEEV